MAKITARDLTVVQREAIRTINANRLGRNTGWGNGVSKQTLKALEKRGIVCLNERGDVFALCNPIFGDLHRQIMASGNGPEQLKAMFRF